MKTETMNSNRKRSIRFSNNSESNSYPKIPTSSSFKLEESYNSDGSSLLEEIPEEKVMVSSEANPGLIRITRPFRTRWDLLMMLLALYTCFTVPFFVAFLTERISSFMILNIVIDIVFILDIFMNFYTTYIDKNGDEVLDHRRIVKNYLKTTFILDVVGSFPMDNLLLIFGSFSDETEVLVLSDLLKLLRILRLSRIIRFTRTRDDVKAIMKLLQLTLYLIIWVHLTGCLWFIVVREKQDWVPVPDWITGTTTFYEDDVWVQYFTCFYHAVWLLTGGEVGPRNSFQAFLASILIIVGALITAVLFGEMAVLMSNLNKRQTEFQEILDGSLTTMNNMRLPPQLTNKILDFITQTQSSLSVQEEYETFQKFISPSLQHEVSACIYEPIISKNTIFQYDERLQQTLTRKLYNKFTKPEQEVIAEGAEADYLYFLVKGECQVFVTDRFKVKQHVCYLNPGCHFGEIALVYKTVRTASVQGVDYCNIAELHKEDYKALIFSFPQLVDNLRSGTEIYNDKWKLFLQTALGQAKYFEHLPPSTFSELVYFMSIIKLERGEYLFKPGQKATHIYILVEGELESSITINEKHLHLLKKEEKIVDMESAPKIPKRQTTLADYEEFNFSINTFRELKHKAEIVPVMNDGGVVESISLEDEGPENSQTIGDYPQEIVLGYLSQGTLISSKLALRQEPYQVQCKALRNSTVYALSVDRINNLCKSNSEFKEEVYRLKQVQTERHFAVNCIDFVNEEEAVKVYEAKWKTCIVNTILYSREQKRKSSSQIASMVSKLQAIIACDEAGNSELSALVASGQIPPHHIRSDGTLDPAAGHSMHSSLPKAHPIMKVFRGMFESVTQPGGALVKAYGDLEDTIVNQTQEIEMLESELLALKEKLMIVASSRENSSKPPLEIKGDLGILDENVLLFDEEEDVGEHFEIGLSPKQEKPNYRNRPVLDFQDIEPRPASRESPEIQNTNESQGSNQDSKNPGTKDCKNSELEVLDVEDTPDEKDKFKFNVQKLINAQAFRKKQKNERKRKNSETELTFLSNAPPLKSGSRQRDPNNPQSTSKFFDSSKPNKNL